MSILGDCCNLVDVAGVFIKQLEDVRPENSINLEYLHTLRTRIETIEKLLLGLDKWSLNYSVISSTNSCDTESISNYAKSLIAAVCTPLGNNNVMSYNVNIVDGILQNSNPAELLFGLMGQYVDAASFLTKPNELDGNQKYVLSYVFGISSDFLEKCEYDIAQIIQARDDFIAAFVSWNTSHGKMSHTASNCVDTQLLPSIDDTLSDCQKHEAAIVQNEQAGTTDSKRTPSQELNDASDTVTPELSAKEKESLNLFASMLMPSLCSSKVFEAPEEPSEGVSNVSAGSALEKKQPATEEQPHESESDKSFGLKGSVVEAKENSIPTPYAEFDGENMDWDAEEEDRSGIEFEAVVDGAITGRDSGAAGRAMSEPDTVFDDVTDMDSNDKGDANDITEELYVDETEDEFGTPDEVFEPELADSKTSPVIPASAPTTHGAATKQGKQNSSESVTETQIQSEKTSPFKKHEFKNIESLLHSDLEFRINNHYSQHIEKWVEELQNSGGNLGSITLDDNLSEEINATIYDLLVDYQYAVSRELAATFSTASPHNILSPNVIDVIGSGLYMPIWEEDTLRFFVTNYQLIDAHALCPQDIRLLAVASIPAALVTKAVALDDNSVCALPDSIKQWVTEFLDRRNELTYWDPNEIILYRQYTLRIEKINQIISDLQKCVQEMRNTRLPHDGANDILKSVCSVGQRIGDIYQLICSCDPEKQVYGIAGPESKKLYDAVTNRIGIIERGRSFKDERYVQRLLDEAEKNISRDYGIVPTSPSGKGMRKHINSFLNSVDEWLDLAKVPFAYSLLTVWSKMIQLAVASYRANRQAIITYANSKSCNTVEAAVINQLVKIMDFFAAVDKQFPEHCHSHPVHMLRLCSVPTDFIEQNSDGFYRYTCQDSVERLIYLDRVLKSELVSLNSSFEGFLENDAFTGCKFIMEFLPPTAKNELDQKKAARIEELSGSVEAMREQLFHFSSYSGWLSNDYLAAIAQVTQIELMLRTPTDVGRICRIAQDCSGKIEAIKKDFKAKLISNIMSSRPDTTPAAIERYEKMIAEGRYSIVFELAENPDYTEGGATRNDFFKQHYYNPEIYLQKQNFLASSQVHQNDVKKDLIKAITDTTRTNGFNFSTVPGGIGVARIRLLNSWYDARKTMASIDYSSDRDLPILIPHLRGILDGIGWKVTDLKNRKLQQIENGGFARFDMQFNSVYSRDTCPIPHFGSRSRGIIRFFCLQGARFAPDKLLDLYSSYSDNLPVIIFFFGTMTQARRNELRRSMLENRLSFLVVDTMIITTICERRDQILQKWLFTLSVPFSYQEMYTSSMGIVQHEMFYGRVSAKRQLGLSGNSCAVYGGRQLGKTVLLKNICEETHDPAVEHYAYYCEFKKYPIADPEREFLQNVGNKLKKEITALNDISLDIDSMMTIIEDWLDECPNRKLLLLLDEMDEFFVADSKLRDRFKVTSWLNKAMNETNMRFKVVFAGLHNVYRTVHGPNQPLAHLGAPISIGPLLDDDFHDAINLIQQPFEILGYRFESPELIIQILGETNYFPSLIQLFCITLHQYLLRPNIRQKKEATLPVIIHKADVDAVANDPALKEQIRERFTWTLDLDLRYKAIALSIALDAANANQADAQNDIVKGYDLKWIVAEVGQWPDLFNGQITFTSIRSLCDELIQLGILRKVSDDRYTLRTTNVLRLLGSGERILDDLSKLGSETYNYSTMYNSMLLRNIFHSPENFRKCYPLTNQQIDLLMDNSSVKLVIGNKLLGIDLIEACLSELLAINLENPTVYDLFKQKRYAFHIFDRLPAIDELGDCNTVNLIRSTCPWERSDLAALRAQLDALDAQTRPIVAVLCSDSSSYRFFVEDEWIEESANVISLTKWDPEAIHYWLNAQVSRPLNDDAVKTIEKRLCGWPFAMYTFLETVNDSNETVSLQGLLDCTVNRLAETGTIRSIIDADQLDPKFSTVLSILVEYDDYLDAQEIITLMENEDEKHLARLLSWMAENKILIERLAAHRNSTVREPNKYAADPLIAELWRRERTDPEPVNHIS